LRFNLMCRQGHEQLYLNVLCAWKTRMRLCHLLWFIALFQFTLIYFFYIITVLGVRLKLAFLPPFYKLDLTFVSDSLHPHPAGTPDALYLVPRACCFPPSGGQNVEAAFMIVLPYTLCVVLPINSFVEPLVSLSWPFG
jgi:hypothetical protein